MASHLADYHENKMKTGMSQGGAVRWAYQMWWQGLPRLCNAEFQREARDAGRKGGNMVSVTWMRISYLATFTLYSQLTSVLVKMWSFIHIVNSAMGACCTTITSSLCLFQVSLTMWPALEQNHQDALHSFVGNQSIILLIDWLISDFSTSA